MSELGHRELSSSVIKAAIAVHKSLGPEFLESEYENALGVELRRAGIHLESQQQVVIMYQGEVVGPSRLDLLVAGVMRMELKVVLHWRMSALPLLARKCGRRILPTA